MRIGMITPSKTVIHCPVITDLKYTEGEKCGVARVWCVKYKQSHFGARWPGKEREVVEGKVWDQPKESKGKGGSFKTRRE